jgi:hypothetical protein
MKITNQLINDLLKLAAPTSRSQKGDISKQLEQQGFFGGEGMPEALKTRSPQLSGGNPVDIKGDFEKQNKEKIKGDELWT